MVTSKMILLFVEKFIELFGIKFSAENLSFDIADIVKQLLGKILYKEDMDKQAALVKNEDGTFTIHLNSRFSAENQRFSVAHELGHLIIQYMYRSEYWDKLPTGVIANQDVNSSDIENEQSANAFAYELLMPRKEFIQASRECIKNGAYDIKEMAEKFELPTEIIDKRGLNLGLW